MEPNATCLANPERFKHECASSEEGYIKQARMDEKNVTFNEESNDAITYNDTNSKSSAGLHKVKNTISQNIFALLIIITMYSLYKLYKHQ